MACSLLRGDTSSFDIDMDDAITDLKEYEALCVMRDIALILYDEICTNLGRDSGYLCSVYEHINGLVTDAGKRL